MPNSSVGHTVKRSPEREYVRLTERTVEMRLAVPCPQAPATIKEQRRVVQGAIVAFRYRAGREPDAKIARACGERRAPRPVQGFRRTGRVAGPRTPVETTRPQLRQADEIRSPPGEGPATRSRGPEFLDRRPL